MSLKTLFGDSSLTRNFKIYFDDILLKNDEIITFEMKFDMFSFFTFGYLSFRDSFSISNSNAVKISEETTIRVEILDRYNYFFKCNFKPVKIEFDDTEKRVRNINVQLVDEVSFNLAKETDSKSYDGKVTDFFKKQFSKYNLPFGYSGKFSFNEKHNCISEKLISSSGEPTFDFFKSRLKMQGISFWMNHYEYCLKELNVKNFNDLSDVIYFRTDITNNDNIFKINQVKRKNSSKASIPVSKIEYTTTSGKIHKTTTISVKDLVQKVELNNNASDFLSGDENNKISVTSSLGAKLEEFNQLVRMIKNNQIIVFVSGSFKYANVGDIVKVFVDSKSPYTEQQLSGDPTASGKYIITSVVDKFIGTKFGQKITLSRFDNPKVLKI